MSSCGSAQQRPVLLASQHGHDHPAEHELPADEERHPEQVQP